MDDKSALLNQLRIDRGSDSAPSTKAKIWRIAALGLLAAAGIATWWWTRPTGVPVHVVTTQAVAGDGAGAAGSILDASGYVVPRRQATVASKITAKMVELDIEEGDHVKAGQIIAKLDDTNLRAALNQASAQLDFAKASLTETQVNLANALRDYERQKSLLQGHFVSQAAVDNSQTTFDGLRAQLATQRSNVDVVAEGMKVAQRNLDDTIVRAPFSGIVTVKSAQPGEMVSPVSAGGGFTRTGIGTIVDMDSLEVEVDVSENFINRVRPQQPVTIKLNAYPDWDIPGSVIAMIPTADRAKATVKVRIAIKQKDPRIIPEMGARVAFLSEDQSSTSGADKSVAPGVIVPTDAVVTSGDTSIVYMVHGSTVERRAVRLGSKMSSGQIIMAGLEAGNTVALGDLSK